jgi:hypothetical protein
LSSRTTTLKSCSWLSSTTITRLKDVYINWWRKRENDIINLDSQNLFYQSFSVLQISFRNTLKRSKRKWSMISKRIVFNFMNAIASTLLTHHKKRFKTIIEAKVVIEKNFENEIEIEIEKILIFINHSRNHWIAVKSNVEIAKWEIITHVIARSLSKTIKKKRTINRRNLRRLNLNRLKKDYQTYVHYDNFISEYRTKNDSNYDKLWRNVQFYFSDENQEMRFAKIRQRITRTEDAERHSF